MQSKWTENVLSIRFFMQALVEAEYLEDKKEIVDFLREPEGYTEMYNAWMSFGSPNEGEENWNEYYESLWTEEDDEDSEESEETTEGD
jgi:hypothetical protein